jgi:uncharacterized protein YecT (DUF1311 family)
MMLHLALILLSAQNPQWNCEDPQAQQEMNFCAAQDYRRADAELNTAYRAAIESARQADWDMRGLRTARADRMSAPARRQPCARRSAPGSASARPIAGSKASKRAAARCSR